MRFLSMLLLLGALALAPGAHAATPPARAGATCSDYDNQAEAQRQKDTRDADGDGIYCEALPCPCLKPGGGGGGGGGGDAERRKKARARARARRKKARERKLRRQIKRSHARIIRVVDGDTVRVSTTGTPKKRYTVRLLGIDTPETKKPGTPIECGGPEATSAMFNFSFTAPVDSNGDKLFDRKGGKGVRVKLRTDRTQKIFDRFDRLLAYIDVPAGARGPGIPAYDISQAVIFLGYSRVYTFKRRVHRYDDYRDVQQQAKAAGRGVWSQCGGDFHRPQ